MYIVLRLEAVPCSSTSGHGPASGAASSDADMRMVTCELAAQAQAAFGRVLGPAFFRFGLLLLLFAVERYQMKVLHIQMKV